MSREALKLALEALEYIHEGANNQGPHTGISWRCVSNKAESAITALRQALANEALDKMAENARELGLDYEPAQQQEPVAWRYLTQYDNESFWTYCAGEPANRETRQPLYTSQPASKPWVGLTDEEKSDLWCESTGRDCVNEDTHVFADAIEAKLREKNNG